MNIPQHLFEQAKTRHEQDVAAHLHAQHAARLHGRASLRAAAAHLLRGLADRLEPLSVASAAGTQTPLPRL